MAEIPHAKGQSSAAEGQSWLCPRARQRTAPKRKAAILSGMWGSYLKAARRFGADAIFQKPLDIDRRR